jgi:hypothetical protein
MPSVDNAETATHGGGPSRTRDTDELGQRYRQPGRCIQCSSGAPDPLAGRFRMRCPYFP